MAARIVSCPQEPHGLLLQLKFDDFGCELYSLTVEDHVVSPIISRQLSDRLS
jgi:hypothetical protein